MSFILKFFSLLLSANWSNKWDKQNILAFGDSQVKALRLLMWYWRFQLKSLLVTYKGQGRPAAGSFEIISLSLEIKLHEQVLVTTEPLRGITRLPRIWLLTNSHNLWKWYCKRPLPESLQINGSRGNLAASYLPIRSTFSICLFLETICRKYAPPHLQSINLNTE